jgi:hypothetical protein
MVVVRANDKAVTSPVIAYRGQVPGIKRHHARCAGCAVYSGSGGVSFSHIDLFSLPRDSEKVTPFCSASEELFIAGRVNKLECMDLVVVTGWDNDIAVLILA